MKKILLIAAVAGLSMVSCKKDRVCTCTETPTSGVVVNYKVTYYNSKKSDARLLCQGEATQRDYTAPVSNTGDKTTCELK